MKSIVFLLIFAISGSNSLNWVGKFQAIDQCNQAECCCLTGDVELKELSLGVLSLRSDLVGFGCPTTGKLDVSMNHPSGFNGSYSVESDTIVIKLSQDSQTINTYNPRLPACINQAERLEDSTSMAPSTSTVHTQETTTLTTPMVANTTGSAAPMTTGNTGLPTTATITSTGLVTTETIQNSTMSAANQLATSLIYPNLFMAFLFIFHWFLTNNSIASISFLFDQVDVIFNLLEKRNFVTVQSSITMIFYNKYVSIEISLWHVESSSDKFLISNRSTTLRNDFLRLNSTVISCWLVASYFYSEFP